MRIVGQRTQQVESLFQPQLRRQPDHVARPTAYGIRRVRDQARQTFDTAMQEQNLAECFHPSRHAEAHRAIARLECLQGQFGKCRSQ